MFGWLRRWHQRATERAIEQLVAENKAWKAQWRAEHGDEPFPMTSEERRELKEKRDRPSPELRKELGDDDDFFGLEDEI